MATKPAAADVVTAYARRVVAGRVVVNKLHRLACARHLEDLKQGPKRGLKWNPELAEKAIAFFKLLHHYKGEWAGKPLELAPWQEFIVGSICGWTLTNGLRRFREAYEEVPRKNGKSTKDAGLALLLTFFDGEPAAEGFCAATKKDQARIVWGDAKQMVLQSPSLKKRITVLANNLSTSTACKLEALGADEDTLDGLNPHYVEIDEVHAHRTSGVVDVLKTAVGSRRQPLIKYVTTAGYDRQSVCWRLHEYSCQVLEGVVRDDSFFAFIACADDDDDWREERTWRKANPNYGVSVKPEKLMRDCLQAQQVPAWQNRFKRLHLNIWTEQADRAIDLDIWTAGNAPVNTDRLAAGCWGGLDLASRIDIAAFAMVSDPDDEGYVDVDVRFWMPEERVQERSKNGGVRFDLWVEQGYITTTPGNVIDYDEIEREILELAADRRIHAIGFDRWNASQLVAHLQDAFGDSEGRTQMIEIGQGFASLSGPTKELLKLVTAKRIRHGGNPVLTWMARNLALRQDPAGNLKPDRQKSAEKIDGIVAILDALALRDKPAVREACVYDERGIREIPNL